MALYKPRQVMVLDPYYTHGIVLTTSNRPRNDIVKCLGHCITLRRVWNLAFRLSFREFIPTVQALSHKT